MIVANNSVNQYSPIQSMANHSPLPTEQRTATASQEQVSISDRGMQLQQKEREIALRYDVTNMTHSEKTSMANELRDNGLIDAKMHLSLSFDLSEVAQKHPKLNLSTGQKMNFVDAFKGELEVAKQHGETATGIQMRENMIAVLEQMHKLRTG